MPNASFKISPQPTAIARLLNGPAAATHNMSRFGRRRLPKFTGTGLAQPNMIGVNSSVNSGTTIVPSQSMWRSGFRLMRPAACAVMSPKWRAT